MTDRKPCYGKMFPETLHIDPNKAVRGKAFSCKLESLGLGRSGRNVSVIPEEWEDCLTCRDFDHCYKLSMGQLALASAISEK
ncbi:hypothetical protein [Hyphomonas sp.]|uniref:hypothetical protein n=1 Tax=Hyphomonas sp. TaxID=87 RepID=UPI000C49B65B|nr:hypothetical protein [Hyphomonas sp.]MAB11451.1 hypothetical protein [Hyphomonas sp.]MBM59694.1 hypothetical protein [Hyphomonas sp.]